jgi:hypothetical protein
MSKTGRFDFPVCLNGAHNVVLKVFWCPLGVLSSCCEYHTFDPGCGLLLEFRNHPGSG